MKKKSLLFLLPLFVFLSVGAQIYEAEEGALVGVQKASSRSGFSGSGYITGFDNENDRVTLTFSWENEGKFQLYIGYAAPYGDKKNNVWVNGEHIAEVQFLNGTRFTEVNVGKIVLQEGENTLSVVNSWGWFELDYIRIAEALPSAEWSIPTSPVNPEASPEAVRLYQFLRYHFGKTTFAGQFQSEDKSYTANNSDIRYIHQITGKYPALYGNDLIDYSPSRIEFGASSQATDDVIKWYKNLGGMVTLTWHWNAPTDLPNTSEQPWWSGFYTRATTFDLAWVLAHPESEKYALLLRDIDAIAQQLKRLQAENIPVLWRPLHEAEGAWFWWGAKGPEPCVQLWRLLYDRITRHHAINNLLWVWTTTDSPFALEWYPGDDYVDILGVDVYLSNGNYSASAILFDNLRNLFEGKRMLTMSENGTLPSPEKMVAQEARWLYNCTWVGDFVFDPEVNSVGHKIAFFNHAEITTLDEMQAAWEAYTGVDGKKKRRNPEVYPNPAMNRVTFRLNPQELPEKITLVAATGKETLLFCSNEMQQELNLSLDGIGPGFYLVRFYFAHSVQNHKLQIINSR